MPFGIMKQDLRQSAAVQFSHCFLKQFRSLKGDKKRLRDANVF